MIDIKRVIEKLDIYLYKKEFNNAERHLLYWLDEAYFFKDENSILTIYNEIIGFYRKQKRKDGFGNSSVIEIDGHFNKYDMMA